MDHRRYAIEPNPPTVIQVSGSDEVFPVRRIWCVGRNYVEHIREMGQDDRAPPFFFAKPTDSIVLNNQMVTYPPLTNDFQHEVELVVALQSGGRDIGVSNANSCIFGYAVGLDLTRRDLQLESRNSKRPWENGKSFDASAPCGPITRAGKSGHLSKGRIALKCNGTIRQEGDIDQMIWNVAEIVSKLSEMVELAAGDIIMTGTPAGVSAVVPGDTLECEIAGLEKLTITIGPKLR